MYEFGHFAQYSDKQKHVLGNYQDFTSTFHPSPFSFLSQEALGATLGILLVWVNCEAPEKMDKG